ncbi:MAG: DNA-directed RNA polymerase subunit omega [Proteobacteria bacterium]|nr:DNA-directed RNA polymerase subunit omega [Pseudomonadota bacterium]
MARVTVEDCMKHVKNRFELIMVASKRTKQLVDGSKSRIENKGGDKPHVLALREIAAGKIKIKEDS